jgi:hypothetical protein
MKRFFYLCIALSIWAPSPAPAAGTLFDKAFIYGLSVQGFRLDMPATEAALLLKKDGWKGRWLSPDEPDFNFPFTRSISSLYLQVYMAPDRKRRLWSVTDRQRFDRTGAPDIIANRALSTLWVDTVVHRYGPASLTFVNANGVNAYVVYRIDHLHDALPRLEAYLNAAEASYELTDPSLTLP